MLHTLLKVSEISTRQQKNLRFRAGAPTNKIKAAVKLANINLINLKDLFLLLPPNDQLS